MADSLAKNPIALRQCLLYEFLQGKSAEKAFDDVSQTVGKNVMNKEQIQILFRRFAKGKFYKNRKKHDHANAKDIFQSDKKALRTCILYLSLKSSKRCEEHDLFRFNPSFVMYEEFRMAIGEEVMEYREFDFWVHRFLNEEYDLNFERDEDKKVYELLDMPIDIMKNIVEYLDICDRAKVRRTSKAFRSFIDSQPLFLKRIFFHSEGLDCEIEMRSNSNETHSTIYTDIQQDEYAFGPDIETRLANKDYYLKCAMEHLKSIIQTPNLHSEHFVIENEWSCLWEYMHMNYEDVIRNDLLNGLASVFDQSTQPHIKSIYIKSTALEPAVNFLSYLKPGYLNRIALAVGVTNGTGFSKMLELEQFKQAKIFSVCQPMLFGGSVRDLLHLDSFYVHVESLSVEDLRTLREAVFKSSTFEYCSLCVEEHFDSDGIRRELDSLVPGTSEDTFRHLIPNTDDCFEITIKGQYRILVSRIKNYREKDRMEMEM